MSSTKRAAFLCLFTTAIAPNIGHACSSCGCTLNSDWGTQGYTTGTGLRFDLRADYFNQDQLRTGTGTVDRASFPFPTSREIQQETINRNYTLSVDYSPNADWGLTAQVPYFNRFHTTVVDGDTDVSTSHTNSLGDARLLGRYQGFTADRSVGVQFGIKFATGSFHNDFLDGPQAGTPLDRGLQPGTGTTDLLVGVYRFGSLSRDWDYFAQALVQLPMNSHEGFRPGTGLNVNVGVRYMDFKTFVPHIQLNIRAEKPESGTEADVENSGATLFYLSPGVAERISKRFQMYQFFQVPVYQRVSGFQLEPRYTVSIGVHYSM
jgi:hypothetical protein